MKQRRHPESEMMYFPNVGGSRGELPVREMDKESREIAAKA